jgi:hypothetical protein
MPVSSGTTTNPMAIMLPATSGHRRIGNSTNAAKPSASAGQIAADAGTGFDR